MRTIATMESNVVGRTASRAISWIGLVLGLFCFACITGTGTQQEGWRGMALPETADFESSSSLFLISNDGRWLLFEATSDGTVPALALYDLLRRRRLSVAVTREAASRLGNVVLEGRQAFFDSRTGEFVLPTMAGDSSFVVAIAPGDQAARVSLDLSRRGGAPAESPSPADNLAIMRLSPREIELRQGARVVARHQVSGLDNNLEVLEIRISADGDFAAYRLSGTRGGSFTFGPEGYVVGLRENAAPIPMGSRIYSSFCWHPRGDSIFAFAADPQGRRAIFRWELARTRDS